MLEVKPVAGVFVSRGGLKHKLKYFAESGLYLRNT